MAMFLSLSSVLKNFGKSLKLFSLGFTDPLKVPILYSKFFLVSIRIVFFLLTNLFHFFGSIWLFIILLLNREPIGTSSFLILILPLWKG